MRRHLTLRGLACCRVSGGCPVACTAAPMARFGVCRQPIQVWLVLLFCPVLQLLCHGSPCSVLLSSADSNSTAARRLDEAIRLPLAAAATALAFVPQGGIVPPLLAVSCGSAGTQLWSEVLRCFVAAAVC